MAGRDADRWGVEPKFLQAWCISHILQHPKVAKLCGLILEKVLERHVEDYRKRTTVKNEGL